MCVGLAIVHLQLKKPCILLCIDHAREQESTITNLLINKGIKLTGNSGGVAQKNN